MVREIRSGNLFDRVKKFSSTPFFVPVLFLLFLILTVPVISFVTSKPVDIRQRAQGTQTATINITPSGGPITLGQTFSVDLVIDGGGQTFNAAQADISISSNLTVQSLTITPAGQGGCNFIFVNQQKTPTVTSPSFAAAQLSGSVARCTLFTMTLLANATGTGTINLSNASVISQPGHEKILLSYTNGLYQINPVPTPTTIVSPTPTPTTLPTPTPTSLPTATPTAIPSPTPTTAILQPPTIDQSNVKTYDTSITLTGTKSQTTVLVFVNGSSSGVTYPTSTAWTYPAALVLGANNFSVYGQDSSGTKSSPVGTTVTVDRVGDITGDNVIDLTDLSIFGTDWDKTSGFNDPLSDMNSDGVVDLVDFSIIAAAYGT